MEYWNIIYFPIHLCLSKSVINMLLVPVSCKSKSCFVTESQILIWNPHFSEMLIYDTQLKNLTDLNDNKIFSYFHKSVTKMSLLNELYGSSYCNMCSNDLAKEIIQDYDQSESYYIWNLSLGCICLLVNRCHAAVMDNKVRWCCLTFLQAIVWTDRREI